MNIQKMMQQAQAMQSKIAEMQAQMESQSYDGAAGGGVVKVTINGKGYAQKFSVDDSLLAVSEKEMLEDLLVAAFNDARARMEESFSDQMGKVTSGLSLPPGFKLPF